VLTVNTPPVITGQPSSATVLAGGTAQFAVTATGASPLMYQWRRNNTNVAGATGAGLVLANVQPANAGAYNCLVSKSLGTGAERRGEA